LAIVVPRISAVFLFCAVRPPEKISADTGERL
jgi:hypothetical protein